MGDGMGGMEDKGEKKEAKEKMAMKDKEGKGDDEDDDDEEEEGRLGETVVEVDDEADDKEEEEDEVGATAIEVNEDEEDDEIDEVCDPNPCTFGTCSRLSTPEGDDEAECSCFPGYVGNFCNVTDPNGASCDSMTRRNGDFRCLCPRDYTGHRCEYLDPCLPNNPCMNGGTCVVRLGSIVDGVPKHDCACEEGFAGRYCGTAILK
ncbi:MAG: hypothetical protein SGARI_005291 [Bacillariaceae sp.]